MRVGLETLFATIFLLFAQCAEQTQPAQANVTAALAR
jgi:hypothetical protein